MHIASYKKKKQHHQIHPTKMVAEEHLKIIAFYKNDT